MLFFNYFSTTKNDKVSSVSWKCSVVVFYKEVDWWFLGEWYEIAAGPGRPLPNCKPVCVPPCQHGGLCVRLGVCHCQAHFLLLCLVFKPYKLLAERVSRFRAREKERKHNNQC
jgi:hypothetical protein